MTIYVTEMKHPPIKCKTSYVIHEEWLSFEYNYNVILLNCLQT